MKPQHVAWIISQVAVGITMLGMAWTTVTGAAWWFVLNLTAGVLATAAGILWSRHRLCFQLSTTAAALYAPVNPFIGLANLAGSDFYGPIHGTLIGLSLLQVLIAFGAYKHRNGF